MIQLRAIKHKASSAKKAPSKKVLSSSYAKGLMLYVMFCGVLVVTLSSFISIELAALNFGLFALCLFVAYEYLRRRDWEKSSDLKLQRVQKVQDNLRGEIAQNKQSLHTIRMDISDIADDVASVKRVYPYVKNGLGQHSDNGKNDFVAPSAAPANAPYAASFTAPFPSVKNLAVKNLGGTKISTLVANDDPFGEYASLSDNVVQELIRNAIENKRIDIFAQPIVRLPHRKPVAYEMYARIRAKAGLYVPAGRYMKLARSQNIASDIDNLLLVKCLEMLGEQDKSGQDIAFFLNIEPASLKDMAFMDALVRFMAQNRSLARKLVFEIPYSVYQTLPPKILGIMAALAKLGCSYSLDHVATADLDVRSLMSNNIRYLKLTGDWMLTQMRSDFDFTHLWRTKQKLEANGIRVIVDKIESDTTLLELFDFDPHYGQGYLFGKPDMPGAFEPFAYAKQFTRRKGFEETFG